jgi:hypothetical protein
MEREEAVYMAKLAEQVRLGGVLSGLCVGLWVSCPQDL